MKEFILLLMTSSFVFSQNNNIGKVEYTMILNLGQTQVNESVLIFNSKESYFFWNVSESDVSQFSVDEEIDDENSTKLNIKFKKTAYTDSIGTFNYKNFIKKEIISRGFVDKKQYYIKENISIIKWKIEKDTKIIGTFNCQKATGTFRGRKYTAWFTNQIPISNGPWKLQGLPGLIIEATDETKEVSFIFKSLKIPSNSNMPEIKVSSENYISLMDFEKIKHDYINNFFNDKKVKEKFASRLPRNVSVKVQVEKKIKSLEIINLED